MSLDLRRLIREVPDFPKPGINFKDITPLLLDPQALHAVIDRFAAICEEADLRPDAIAGPEARGFIFGVALAYRLRVGFVPIRKPGKLPYQTKRVEYELEYGTDSVEMHVDAIDPGKRVVLVDDLLATGGTIQACVDLVEAAGAEVVSNLFVVELGFLEGRERLGARDVRSLVCY